MNDGDYRLLAALASGERLPRTEVIRRSGEAHSVLADLELRKGKWFERRGPEVQLAPAGQRAHAMECAARTPALDQDALVARLTDAARARPTPRRELDQVHATLETTARRALHLVAAGEGQRGLLFLGDDDLTALAVAVLLDAAEARDVAAGETPPTAGRKVHVLDVDERLVAHLAGHERVVAAQHDLREPLPRALQGRFGAVFTDPPYALGGFRLFGNRALEGLKADGRLYVCFGQSRRSLERGLAKQRALAELGVLVEAVHPDFNAYDGAESIGARSSLWVTRRTAQSRPLELDPDAPLYTRDRADPAG